MKKILAVFLAAFIALVPLSVSAFEVPSIWNDYNREMQLSSFQRRYYDLAITYVDTNYPNSVKLFMYRNGDYFDLYFLKNPKDLEKLQFTYNGNRGYYNPYNNASIYRYNQYVNNVSAEASFSFIFDSNLRTFEIPSLIPEYVYNNNYAPLGIDVDGFNAWVHNSNASFYDNYHWGDRYLALTEKQGINVDVDSLKYYLQYFNNYGSYLTAFLLNYEQLAPVFNDYMDFNRLDDNLHNLFTTTTNYYNKYNEWLHRGNIPVPDAPINPDTYMNDITVTDTDDIYVILLRQIIQIEGNQLNTLYNINFAIGNLNGLINTFLNNMNGMFNTLFAKLDGLEISLNASLNQIDNSINSSSGSELSDIWGSGSLTETENYQRLIYDCNEKLNFTDSIMAADYLGLVDNGIYSEDDLYPVAYASAVTDENGGLLQVDQADSVTYTFKIPTTWNKEKNEFDTTDQTVTINEDSKMHNTIVLFRHLIEFGFILFYVVRLKQSLPELIHGGD